MKPLALIALLAAAAPALAEEEEKHVFELSGLEVLHPWTNATDEDHTTLFMELHNESDAVIEILSALTSDGVEGHLVGFALKDGEMTMQDLPAMPVGPGQHLELEPDVMGFHFDGLSAGLAEGDHWDVTLVTSAGALVIEAEVEAAGARQHGHAGHNH